MYYFTLSNLPLTILVPILCLVGAWVVIKFVVQHHVDLIRQENISAVDAANEFKKLYDEARNELNEFKKDLEKTKKEVSKLRWAVRAIVSTFRGLLETDPITKDHVEAVIDRARDVIKDLEV